MRVVILIQAVLREAGVLEQLLQELGAHLGPLLESEYIAAAAFLPFLEGLLAQEPDQAQALHAGIGLLQPVISHSQACMRYCPLIIRSHTSCVVPI